MEKVFCSECKHYSSFVDIAGGAHHDCNINTWIDDNPIRRYIRPKDARDVNRNNDCPKFERKLSKRTIVKLFLKEVWKEFKNLHRVN
jgi:hypothetical protein